MLKFRPMTSEEFEILVEKQALESYIKDIEVYKERFIKSTKGKLPREYAEDQFRKLLPLKEKSPRNFFWIAIDEQLDKAIGYIWYTIRPNNKFALLSDILVKKEFQNQGFGTEMIHFMENHLVENYPNLKWIYLQVFRHNPKAKQLYKRLGFWVFLKSYAGWNMIKRVRRKKNR